MHMFGLYRGVVMTLTALLLLTASAAAQQVVVDGAGIDRETALRDASRNAVEQVVGTLVDSRTLAQNAAVQLDEIYTKSQGFVTDIKLLSQTNQAGIVHIRAQVEVNTNPDAQLIEEVQTIDDTLRSLAGDSVSGLGTGGMSAKLTAAKIATGAGVDMVIANGANANVLYDIVDGKDVGTRFVGKNNK